MREAYYNKSVLVKDGKLMQLTSGVDYCAEHEGGSKSIFNFFGCKSSPSYHELMMGKYVEDDFSTSWKDHLITRPDSLVLMRMKISVPSKVYDRFASKALIKEVDDTLAALKEAGTPFRCKKEAYATVLISRHLLIGSPWNVPLHRAQAELEKAGSAYKYPAFDPTSDIYVVEDAQASLQLAKSLDIPGLHRANPRAYSLFYFAEQKGFEMPVLKEEMRIRSSAESRRQDDIPEGMQAYKGSYVSTWYSHGFMTDASRADLDIAFVAVDPVVATWLIQLYEGVKAGKFLMAVPMSKNPFQRGSGVLFQHLDMLTEEDKVSIDAHKVFFKEMCMNLKALDIFEKLNAKNESTSSGYKFRFIKLSSDQVKLDAMTRNYQTIHFETMPIEDLMAWLNGEMSDEEMVEKFARKNV